jgi:hypothetical protein
MLYALMPRIERRVRTLAVHIHDAARFAIFANGNLGRVNGSGLAVHHTTSQSRVAAPAHAVSRGAFGRRDEFGIAAQESPKLPRRAAA